MRLPRGRTSLVPCARHGLYLIEDCAHALSSLYKRRPVGGSGDFSAFSIRKTLSVLHAAALVINNREFRRQERLPSGEA